MAWGEETGGGFALVEHPIAPRGLAAPLHRHANEDEYSFVLEGRMGAQLGDDVVQAKVGDFVFKPRNQWHSFWNAGDEPCRILEIISPAGFERYFEEIGEALEGFAGEPAERGAIFAPIAARYGLEIDPSTIGPLCEEHGLRPPWLMAARQAPGGQQGPFASAEVVVHSTTGAGGGGAGGAGSASAVSDSADGSGAGGSSWHCGSVCGAGSVLSGAVSGGAGSLGSAAGSASVSAAGSSGAGSLETSPESFSPALARSRSSSSGFPPSSSSSGVPHAETVTE